MSTGMIFGLGHYEILIILFVGLIVFGSTLPNVARNLARTFTGFKRGLKDIEESDALKED